MDDSSAKRAGDPSDEVLDEIIGMLQVIYGGSPVEALAANHRDLTRRLE